MLQIDADVPWCNISVVDELLSAGSLAVKLHAQDVGAGVHSVNIYKQTGQNNIDFGVYIL